MGDMITVLPNLRQTPTLKRNILPTYDCRKAAKSFSPLRRSQKKNVAQKRYFRSLLFIIPAWGMRAKKCRTARDYLSAPSGK
jgi:hypothetical protein